LASANEIAPQSINLVAAPLPNPQPLTSATFQPVFHGLNGMPIYSSSIAMHIFPASTFPGIWISRANKDYGEVTSINLEAAKEWLKIAPSERIPESQKKSFENLTKRIWIHEANAVYGEVTSINLEAAQQHLEGAPSGRHLDGFLALSFHNLKRRIECVQRG
jgi:hypothetical protein